MPVITYKERKGQAEEVVAAIRAEGCEALAIAGDTACEEDVARFFNVAEETFGPVEGLVNNAGTAGSRGPLVGICVKAMKEILAVNVLGVMRCAQEAVRRMAISRGGRGGCIVNVSSVGAALGAAGVRVHYAASEGAVNSFTVGLGTEVIREGIRVNAVSPGLTETEMNPPDRLAMLVPTLPIARAARPEEVAKVIMFLLLDGSSYVVGTNLMVTGGRRQPPDPRIAARPPAAPRLPRCPTGCHY